MICRDIQNTSKKWRYNKEDAAAFLQRKRLLLWRIVLLTMWFFLHVFEDSMVNYLFFCMFGLLSGYLSKFYEKKDEVKIIDMFKKDEELEIKK